jgi:hypothetical protein
LCESQTIANRRPLTDLNSLLLNRFAGGDFRAGDAVGEARLCNWRPDCRKGEGSREEFTAGSTPHYYVSVSTGDVTMSDGKSLEGIGVTPDLLLLPTQADLAAGRDPVLAAVISLAGHPMDPADAGRLIPPK